MATRKSPFDKTTCNATQQRTEKVGREESQMCSNIYLWLNLLSEWVSDDAFALIISVANCTLLMVILQGPGNDYWCLLQGPEDEEGVEIHTKVYIWRLNHSRNQWESVPQKVGICRTPREGTGGQGSLRSGGN